MSAEAHANTLQWIFRGAAKPARRKRSSSLSAPIANSNPSGETAEIAAATAPENDRLDPSGWKICAVALFGALLAQFARRSSTSRCRTWRRI
jgi:hypothetical protein